MPIILASALPNPACAQSGILSPDTVHGLAEAEVSAGRTERSWLDGGFGKTAASRDGVAFNQAAIEWRPSFNFAVGAVVSALYQPKVSPSLDIGEAYLKLKAPPMALGRISARVGAFYPPVSLEHEGVAWTTPDMLSGSALNTWVGEEVKVTGVEASLARAFGSQEIRATAAVFGWGDTAGALLTFRGWAIDGVRAGLGAKFPLPPLSAFAADFQPAVTLPVLELDHRGGYYLQLEWRPPAPVSVDVFHYDNGGDRTAEDANNQWAWRTTFTEIGARWEPSETLRLQAQAMTGNTQMGYVTAGGRWFDVDFRSAYLLARRQVGEDALSLRLDGFKTVDRTFVDVDNNSETGWAATAAWRHRLGPHVDLIAEAKRIDSTRPARVLAGQAPRQAESRLETAVRLSF
ncbi:MAG TPA: hypothetical protein VNW53_10505 [Phenylobacterium sp.]|uniref:hypothetical protein n=1 Tax=Phenylobacterium sp. TaxID=1871053 RepID=UPI002B8F160E|nr:hypothetical protein [Phenylobacterium sp.]HXA39423.1 hypothetical protein [Phenylobacterium sp.]